ncbi:MAG: substrate-binding domain-containing protein [Gammaproteobacteria bacterium]
MNLKSLARTLGISKTTVSRALNGYPEVNVHTRARVLAAAKEAGYEANPMARSLAVGRTNVFGIIYPLLPSDLGDPMFLSVVGGMSNALEKSKMNLIIAPVSPANELPSYDKMVRGRRVDGLVVSRTLVRDERIAYLVEKKFPFVAHGRTTLSQPYAWFDYDHDAGMRMACQHLLGFGHRRIALISAHLELNFAAERRRAFLGCLQEAGVQVNPAYLHQDSLDRRTGYQAMQALLELNPRPTAVIVDNHLSGVGAVRALLDHGVAIGRDVSVIVWGSIEDSLVKNVTAIDQPHSSQAGAKMIEMLSSLVAGTPPEQLQTLWTPVLVPGSTTGPCLD